MSNWRAYWSGSYPSLCSGYWELYKDDVKVDTKIPFNNNYEDYDENNDAFHPWPDDAGTFGEYYGWYVGEDCSIQWEAYEQGLTKDEWCKEHSEWLVTLAPESEWGEVFRAFQAEDWRTGSCGGCI